MGKLRGSMGVIVIVFCSFVFGAIPSYGLTNLYCDNLGCMVDFAQTCNNLSAPLNYSQVQGCTNAGDILKWNAGWTCAPDDVSGVLALEHGGTNATDAAGARTSLGAAASGTNSDITSLTGLTTPLSVTQGGTGSDTKNFLDLNTDQTLGGTKTFSNQVVSNVATGTAPFQVSSTTMVNNFNAEMVGGKKVSDLDSRYGLALPSFAVRGRTATNTLDSTGNVGRHTSIAIGTDGFPVISYRDVTNQYLKVAKCGDASCTPASATINTLDNAVNVGINTSITIGTDAFPVISYYDLNSRDLKVAKCGDTACTPASATINTLDSTEDVGAFTSITIGTDGFPVISYLHTNAIGGDLKVVKCGDAACTPASSTINILDNGYVGGYTSITIGTDGFPVISYYDAGNADLKVAKCGDAACTPASAAVNTLDGTGNVGGDTSITTGTDGFPVISYRDATNLSLKVAKCGDAACTPASAAVNTLDGTGNVGMYTSITIGTDGFPIISYYDYTNGDLKVVKCRDVACSPALATLNAVDSTGDVGTHTSITIGTDGFPVISYYDVTNGDLKVAKCNNIYCVTNWGRR